MFKQIYRFLSILIISNLLFSSAGIGKTHVNTASSGNLNSVLQDENEFNEDKPIDNQKPNGQDDPNLEKMPTFNSGEAIFTTLYGVISPNDIYNTYPYKPQSYDK
jgi:hypothetical protein